MTPKPAATLVIVRQNGSGPEVLMVERPARGFFGGLWVFPGGGVEPIDESAAASSVATNPADATDVRWRIAAMRETIEEVGVAITEAGSFDSMIAQGSDVFEQLQQRGERLDGSRLRLLSQWVTPRQSPKRFDARFYLTVLEGDPPLTPRPGEVMAAQWISPRSALDRSREGVWKLVTPTLHHLEWLAKFDHTDNVWAAAADASGIRVEPTITYDGSEVRVRLPAGADLP